MLYNAKIENVDPVVYTDSTLPYQSKKHLFLSIYCNIFAPLILLTIYPASFFQKISRYHKPRWNIATKIYVDTFQGCYKYRNKWNSGLQSSVWIPTGYVVPSPSSIKSCSISSFTFKQDNHYWHCQFAMIV